MDDLINKKSVTPDIVMVDPPRKGLDNKSVENILKIMPKRLVYISCNPATLVRDLAKLEERFTVDFIKPVDMFPFTRTRRVCCSARTKIIHIGKLKRTKNSSFLYSTNTSSKSQHYPLA